MRRPSLERLALQLVFLGYDITWVEQYIPGVNFTDQFAQRAKAGSYRKGPQKMLFCFANISAEILMLIFKL
jgi:hypothetical protein